jgi:hypothetical protein
LARIREIKALQSHPRRATLPVTVPTKILKPVKACPTGGDCISLHHLGLYEKNELSGLQDVGKHHLSKNDIPSFTLHN